MRISSISSRRVVAETPEYYRDPVRKLYRYFFRERAILFGGVLPVPQIRFGNTVPAMGTFNIKRDGKNLVAVITICGDLLNYPERTKLAESVLLHECLHLCVMVRHPVSACPAFYCGQGDHDGRFRRAANRIAKFRGWKLTRCDVEQWPAIHRDPSFRSAWVRAQNEIVSRWKIQQLERQQAIEAEREKVTERLHQILTGNQLAGALVARLKLLNAGA